MDDAKWTTWTLPLDQHPELDRAAIDGFHIRQRLLEHIVGALRTFHSSGPIAGAFPRIVSVHLKCGFQRPARMRWVATPGTRSPKLWPRRSVTSATTRPRASNSRASASAGNM